MTTQQEERQARAQHRDGVRLARKAAEHRAEQETRRVRLAIAETAHTPGCRCDWRAVRTVDAVKAMGIGCTHPSYVCPRLDAVRRRLGV